MVTIETLIIPNFIFENNCVQLIEMSAPNSTAALIMELRKLLDI